MIGYFFPYEVLNSTSFWDSRYRDPSTTLLSSLQRAMDNNNNNNKTFKMNGDDHHHPGYFPTDDDSTKNQETTKKPPFKPRFINFMDLRSPPKRDFRNLRKNRQGKYMPGFYDEYDLCDEVLGRGATGLVCRCIHRRTQKSYAVKMINKDHCERSRVQRERDNYYVCRPCNRIVDLLEFYDDNNYYYLVFELMEGGHLLQKIAARGKLNEFEASKVTRQVAEALEFMHSKGIAHRDLKPENILCVREDDILPIKVCDFDLAGSGNTLPGTHSPGSSAPILSSPVGTADFMAPEVIDAWISEELASSESAPREPDADNPPVHDLKARFVYDKQCDLWSLGVLIYIMLCGYSPFQAKCSSASCKWEEGLFCEDCRYLTFKLIKRGEYTFPSAEWGDITMEVKSLISKLLVCDAKKRFTAMDVLNHSWIKYKSGMAWADLRTPSILRRDDSANRLSRITSGALSIKKRFDARLNVKGAGVYCYRKKPIDQPPQPQPRPSRRPPTPQNIKPPKPPKTEKPPQPPTTTEKKYRVYRPPPPGRGSYHYETDLFETNQFEDDLTFVRSDLASDLTPKVKKDQKRRC